MIIKKFQANTETEAILLAKEDLGKDAIVMNIKTIKPKGIYKLFKKPVIEITAAIDDNETYNGENPFAKVAEIAKTMVSQEEQNKDFEKTEIHKTDTKKLDIYKNDNYTYDSKKSENRSIEESETSAIEEKLNNLQDLLEKQMNNKIVEEKQNEINKNITFIQLIYNQLISNEVDEKYANQIITEIESTLKKDANVDNILASIYQKIILKIGQPKTIELGTKKPKVVFFIGPTGVGKTTTIAKIASSFKVNKNLKVALLTSDTYRIAAVEQLRTYANILYIPLKVVYSPEEITEFVKEFSEYDLILVDTAGRSHRNKEQCDDILALVSTISAEDREVYLVLSATTKYKDLLKISETYSKITDYKLIFTKLDETSCFGNILNLKMFTGAPLSYATWGQNVPDDIGDIDAQNIAKHLLGGNE